MNKVVREILPVGQGAFYLEILYIDGKTYKIVYDCGSTTAVKYVEREIEYRFEKGEVIDAVFVSHLDDDHVNGLPYLMGYCHIKHLFLPLITNNSKELFELMNLINQQASYNFVTRLLSGSNQSFDGFEGEIHLIPEEMSNEEVERRTSNAIFGSNSSKDWIYLPHNFRDDSRYRQFEAELKKIDSQLSQSVFSSSKLNIYEVSNIWKSGTVKDKDLIKKAYQSLPGGLNTNSMTLYSGTKSPYQCAFDIYHRGYLCKYCCRIGYRNIYPLINNGCLYLGDYDTGKNSGAHKWKSLEKVYGLYFWNIGLIQIPHHGSRYNYNKELRKRIRGAEYFLSAGDKNSYRHPHKDVLVDLAINRKVVSIVTEDISTEANYISFW